MPENLCHLEASLRHCLHACPWSAAGMGAIVERCRQAGPQASSRCAMRAATAYHHAAGQNQEFVMPPTVADVEAQALQLSMEDRAHLADRLLGSLAADPSVEDAWAIEVDRRITEFESGSVVDVPVEDALARARASPFDDCFDPSRSRRGASRCSRLLRRTCGSKGCGRFSCRV